MNISIITLLLRMAKLKISKRILKARYLGKTNKTKKDSISAILFFALIKKSTIGY